MPKLKFSCHGIEVSIPSGTELLDTARKNPELPLKFGCTRGECGVCAVKVVAGMEHLTKCSKQEQETLQRKGLGEDYRLACQCALNGDVEVVSSE
jgi:ferredoxin